jgi:hypothetical protein
MAETPEKADAPAAPPPIVLPFKTRFVLHHFTSIGILWSLVGIGVAILPSAFRTDPSEDRVEITATLAGISVSPGRTPDLTEYELKFKEFDKVIVAKPLLKVQTHAQETVSKYRNSHKKADRTQSTRKTLQNTPLLNYFFNDIDLQTIAHSHSCMEIGTPSLFRS